MVTGRGDTAATVWLSKSDLTAFMRCEQGFALLKTRAVRDVATAGSAVRVALDRGTEFDRRVRDTGTPAVGDDGQEQSLAELLAGDALIYCNDLFENPELEFIGAPDGINPADGSVEPLEIKSYSRYSDRDVFELAFYWLLLEPHRTDLDAAPAGWLQLRDGSGGVGEPFSVTIPAEMISAVRGCAAAARAVLARGVEPYWCHCSVCAQQLLPVTTPQFRSTAPVAVVNDVGAARGAALEAVGVSRVADLLAVDAVEVRDRLRNNASRIHDIAMGDGFGAVPSVEIGVEGQRARGVPSVTTIEKWKRHAEAFVAGQPTLLPGTRVSLPEQFVALDLEYQSQAPKVVWSACVQTYGVTPSHRLTVIADADHQGQLIADLGSYLAGHPGIPVVTWNGGGADLPTLDSVMSAYAMPPEVDVRALAADIRARHLDLLWWTKTAVVLPVPGTGLKDVANYFGAENTAPDMNGYAATHLWEQYQHSRDDTLLATLVSYNRSDVAILVDVANHLRALHHPDHGSQPRTGFDVDELRHHQSSPQRTGAAWQPPGLLRRIGRGLGSFTRSR